MQGLRIEVLSPLTVVQYVCLMIIDGKWCNLLSHKTGKNVLFSRWHKFCNFHKTVLLLLAGYYKVISIFMENTGNNFLFKYILYLTVKYRKKRGKNTFAGNMLQWAHGEYKKIHEKHQLKWATVEGSKQ